jgi:glycosyltransferase involved in cell wall biosynthesis
VGVSDIIEKGNCGIVVPPDDDKAMSKAFIKLLKDEKLRKKLGENGRKLVEDGYTWKHVAENMMKIIADAGTSPE